MTKHLPRHELERLAKLCGLFGSDHAGERASAAAMADRIVRMHGLVWADVITPSSSLALPTRSTREKASFIYANRELLNEWGRDFATNVRRYANRLSARQLHFLDLLVDEVEDRLLEKRP
jgi:hypothetical protein